MESIGFILLMIGSIFAIQAFSISAQHRRHFNFDNRPIWDLKEEHHRRLRKIPKYNFFLWSSVIFILLGLSLIGIFESSPAR